MSGAELVLVYVRRDIPQMNGTTKDVLAGCTALALALGMIVKKK